MSEFFCKVNLKDVPSPDISGLEPPERLDSIYSRLQDFLPHFKRVYEQQAALESLDSELLVQLEMVRARDSKLAATVRELQRSLFSNNLTAPQPAEGPTALPPAQNVFQQKVYGCAVLRSYKDFLSNVLQEGKTLRKLCRRPKPEMNTFFF